MIEAITCSCIANKYRLSVSAVVSEVPSGFTPRRIKNIVAYTQRRRHLFEYRLIRLRYWLAFASKL